MVHEVGHEKLAREKGERDERIEQGRHPHKRQHLHQVLVPHYEKAHESGGGQQPIRRIELGVGGLDPRREKREGNALDDARERQVGRGELALEALGDRFGCLFRVHTLLPSVCWYKRL